MHKEGGESKSNGKVGPIKVTEPVTTARRLAGIRATKPITEEDIPRLRNQWFQDYNDILSGMVPKLPPLREVNHRIPLIDEGKQYSYHLPRCPDALKQQLSDKIRAYTDAGWWEMKNVPQAAPMLCIPKKTGKL